MKATKNRDGLTLRLGATSAYDSVWAEKYAWENSKWANKYTYTGEPNTRVERRVAPPLSLSYSSRKVISPGNVVEVNGHRSRCLAINKKWNETFNVVVESSPAIAIIDYSIVGEEGKIEYHKGGRFVVEITDSTLACKDADVVINYNIGLEREQTGNGRLLGSDWFFFDDTRYQEGLGVHLDNFVLIVPNGNKETFYETIDVGKIASIMNEFSGGSIRVCEGLDREKFDKFVVSADIVITTPSTTAMELASINKPMLLVKTSEDQTGDFSTIASSYSDDILRLLLRNEEIRNAYGKNNIQNNIDKVVNKIYEEWEKWNNEQN